MHEPRQSGDAFQRAVAIMARLRAPDGCPWDRKQTFDSIRIHTIEEVYEVLETIEERNWTGLREELGDLLLQVLFYAQLAAEEDRFDIVDVLRDLADKLVRRHPHVFEDALGHRLSPEEALGRWDAVKAEEKTQRAAAGGEQTQPPASRLGEIPKGLPALLEAAKVSRRAAGVGFDWPDAEGVLLKLEEEIAELRAEIKAGAAPPRLEDEIGDLLFTVVNVGRKLGAEPETALKHGTRKFRRRFEAMESLLEAGVAFESLSPERMDELWRRAKRHADSPQASVAGATPPATESTPPVERSPAEKPRNSA